MGWYERNIFRRGMEMTLGRAPIQVERTLTLARAHGAILEVGIGTGMNLDAYPEGVATITAVSYESVLDPRAEERASRRDMSVRLVAGDATSLPFADATFDTAVCTFLLCSVGNDAATVRELRRVLRPDGQLLFLEHVARKAGVGRTIQHILNPLSLVVSSGCSLVRDSASTIANNGFRIDELVDREVPAMLWPHRRVIRGVASPAV